MSNFLIKIDGKLRDYPTVKNTVLLLERIGVKLNHEDQEKLLKMKKWLSRVEGR